MPTIRTCQTCGTEFPQPAPTGRPPKYCSPPCRVQARSRKPELHADVDFVQAETSPAAAVVDEVRADGQVWSDADSGL